ncbi:MAG: hypothetical protein ACI8Z5_000750 [Lentimonas sp.]
MRLKKARDHLNDALAGLDAAETEKRCDPAWLHTQRQALNGITQTVQSLIDEVRGLLKSNDGDF